MAKAAEDLFHENETMLITCATNSTKIIKVNVQCRTQVDAALKQVVQKKL